MKKIIRVSLFICLVLIVGVFSSSFGVKKVFAVFTPQPCTQEAKDCSYAGIYNDITTDYYNGRCIGVPGLLYGTNLKCCALTHFNGAAGVSLGTEICGDPGYEACCNSKDPESAKAGQCYTKIDSNGHSVGSCCLLFETRVGDSGNQRCCPFGTVGYVENNNPQCCPSGQVIAGNSPNQRCCDAGLKGYTEADGSGVCCNVGKVIANATGGSDKLCCDGPNLAVSTNGGQLIKTCCPANQAPFGDYGHQTCCALTLGATIFNDGFSYKNGWCCRPTESPIGDSGYQKCCTSTWTKGTYPVTIGNGSIVNQGACCPPTTPKLFFVTNSAVCCKSTDTPYVYDNMAQCCTGSVCGSGQNQHCCPSGKTCADDSNGTTCCDTSTQQTCGGAGHQICCAKGYCDASNPSSPKCTHLACNAQNACVDVPGQSKNLCGPGTLNPDCTALNSCDLGNLSITYSWSGAAFDLDTGTNVFGQGYGWSCGGSTNFVSYSGDNTKNGGSETVVINLTGSQKAGLWNKSLSIDLRAGWFAPAGGSGPATVTIAYNNKTITF